MNAASTTSTPPCRCPVVLSLFIRDHTYCKLFDHAEPLEPQVANRPDDSIRFPRIADCFGHAEFHVCLSQAPKRHSGGSTKLCNLYQSILLGVGARVTCDPVIFLPNVELSQYEQIK